MVFLKPKLWSGYSISWSLSTPSHHTWGTHSLPWSITKPCQLVPAPPLASSPASPETLNLLLSILWMFWLFFCFPNMPSSFPWLCNVLLSFPNTFFSPVLCVAVSFSCFKFWFQWHLLREIFPDLHPTTDVLYLRTYLFLSYLLAKFKVHFKEICLSRRERSYLSWSLFYIFIYF